MDMLKLDQYRNALFDLPVKIDSEAGFKKIASKLFPHLVPDVVKAADLLSILKSGCMVALPPLTANDGSLAVNLLEDGTLRAIGFYDGGYENEARQYAKSHWGGKLVSLGSVHEMKVYLLDPRSAKVEHCLYAVLDRPWIAIVRRNTKPRSAVVDDVIIEISLSEVIFTELRVRSFDDVPVFYHCVHCGCGLTGLRCTGCGESFAFCEDDFLTDRPNMGCPLTAKMSNLLVRKFKKVFTIDPKVYRRAEGEQWERNFESRMVLSRPVK